MDKEKEIKELANFIKEASKRERRCRDGGDGYHVGLEYHDHRPTSKEVAEKLHDIGYRKADEVRKEVIKEMVDYVLDKRRNLPLCDIELMKCFARKNGVEVD